MTRTAVVCVTLVLLSVTLVCASTPYEPPEGGDKWQYSTVILKGTAIDKNATGKAVLACNVAETFHRIQVSAKKVVPNGVYSIWLVKLDAKGKKIVRKKRVDNPSRRLKADKYGKLSWASSLNACPQGKFTRVEVRYHKDGNPKNVAGAKTALVGKIP